MSEVADELFLMTNLFPADTGLPMVVARRRMICAGASEGSLISIASGDA
jgi:hypothetical protein